MRSLNRIVIVGRLGTEPDIRVAASGTQWGTLSVATNRSRKDGDTWVEETDWHRVKVFGRLAEQCSQLDKGHMVAVDGVMTYESWTGDDGRKRYSAVIRADQVQFVDTRSRNRPPVAPVAEATADIPF